MSEHSEGLQHNAVTAVKGSGRGGSDAGASVGFNAIVVK